MVLVTQTNFLDELPNIMAKFESAEFISFDLEMTGIFGNERNRKDDNVEERYLRMIPIATKYSILQAGLCFFESNGSGGYTATPFAFLLFPEWGPDIVLSPSSISFLKKNNFDFQSWIVQGLSFVNEVGADNAREQREKKAALLSETKEGEEKPTFMLPNRTEEIDKIKTIHAAIDAFVSDHSAVEYAVPSMNAYLRRCVHSYLEVIHPTLRTRKDDSKPNEIIVMKVTEEQMAQMAAEDENRFNLKLGFRLVFERLCQAGKPIIGHNCFFDLLFIFRWLDRPLPSSFLEFKARFGESLGRGGLYDTKFISTCNVLGNVDKLEDSTLQPLFESTVASQESVMQKIVLAAGHEYATSEKQAHDAGYDAYMTGCIFVSNLMQIGPEKMRAECHNRLYLMQSVYGFTLGPEPNYSFIRLTHGTIFHLSSFAETTKNDDVMAAFGAESIKEIMWIDGSSLFLFVAHGAELVRAPDGWKIQSLAEFEESKKPKLEPQSQPMNSIPSAGVELDAQSAKKKPRTCDMV